MTLEIRLAALSQLMDSPSGETDARLDEEFVKAEKTLQQSVDFDELSAALKTLQVLARKYFAVMIPILRSFTSAIVAKSLTHSGEIISKSLRRFQSPSLLIREAIEVAEEVRYLKTEETLEFLLDLSKSSDDDVSKSAQRAVEKLAEFNIKVFYGESGQGAQPQLRVVDYLSKLDKEKLTSNIEVILRTLAAVLSASMQGSSWTYNQVTIHRGTTPASNGVAEARLSAIMLLKKMYFLVDSVRQRKSILQTLNGATRQEVGPRDDETKTMFIRDALEVLNFYYQLVATEALPILQAIEHSSYWDYYHAASSEIEQAALKIRDALDANNEYRIYKLLIGFEGIFGKWEELKRSESAWDYTDNHRYAAADQFVSEINAETIDQWRKRILDFSKTESDDFATFPVYYQFLQTVGQEHPAFAFELVTEHEDVMKPFLIALMRGLWNSSYLEKVELVVEGWIKQSKNLTAIAKSLFDSEPSRLSVLSAVLRQSVSISERRAIVEIMGVAASLYGQGTTAAKDIFMDGMRALAKQEDASWAQEMWHSRAFRSLIKDLEPRERTELLTALASLPEIDYQAEEILCSIAKYDARGVIDYLVGRLAKERKFRESHPDKSVFDKGNYEAIPFQLHKLPEALEKDVEALLTAIRKDYESETDVMFQFRGARLVKGIFPTFAEPLESLLRKLVESGDSKNVDFVLDILRTYEGIPAIQDLGKEIVKVVPERSEYWRELAAALESTGVVMGEYGFMNAYERKRTEMAAWKNDENARVRAFAEWIIEGLDQMIASEKMRADEELAVRKYRYGVGDEES